MKNEKRLIVLTDDDKEEHVLFKDVVEEFDEIDSLISFEKGIDLLNYLEKSNSKKPHLIFLDLNMPTLNGFECLSKIRENSNYDDLKIIIYSTSSSDKDLELSFKNGADLYITKPFDFFHMKEILDQVLNIDWECRSKSKVFSNFKLAV